jgi:hypothetical protein
MKKPNLSEMTVDQLVELFVDYGLQQDRAIARGVVQKHKQLFTDMFAVGDELKKRVPDARLALTTLFDHPNFQVRLQAARETLAVAPDAARKVIEAISESSHFPQAGDAGMCLWALDQGISKPE